MSENELNNILKWYRKKGLTDDAYDTLIYEIQIIQKDYPFDTLINRDGTINKRILKKDEDLQQVLSAFEKADKTALIFKGKKEKDMYKYGGDFFKGFSSQEKIDTIVSMNKLKKDFIDIKRLTSEQVVELATMLDINDENTKDKIEKIIKEMQGQTQSKLFEALRNL